MMGSVMMGSDPAKWLLLMRYGFKKGVFLLLEGTFWGSKVGFKGFGYWVLGAGCWVLGAGLFGFWAGVWTGAWFVFTAAAPP